MFWWLWSTKKKVAVLGLVVMLPVSLLVARSLFSGGDTVASPTPVADPQVTTVPPTDPTTDPVDETSEPSSPQTTVEPATPLLLAADSSRSAAKALGEIAWLATGANTADVLIPAGENSYSVWAFHVDVDSFDLMADRYEAIYEAAGELVISEATPTLRRFEVTGSVQGVKFLARVRVLDLGDRRVSVVGVVETAGRPGPVTKEPPPLTPQEPAQDAPSDQ